MNKQEAERLLRGADIIDIQMIMGKYLSYLDQVNFKGIYSLMAYTSRKRTVLPEP